MSTAVENQIIKMRFDNQGFESKVRNTLESVTKLQNGLKKNKEAAKSFDEIDKSAKHVKFDGLIKGVEVLHSKISGLEVMSVTALANITNSAVNAGKKIVKALTIDPVKSGFQEYETQINAVQTILANTESKGSTLNDVNAALDELNLYADKTIYNFTEMTRNIGTFTAAGVELDTAVSAIKGIANLAAVSGSTSQQASTAMYQLSQALASGTVKLMDWNSVVNAGMGGQVFQDSLKETAKVHNINIDAMIEKEGSFRETLKSGWLTSELLTETLKKFTGDLSAEQLKQMGYTEQQIKDILKMGQTANDAATKVKTFTQLFDTLKEAAQSGWTSTWEIIIGDFGEAKKTLTEISNVVGDILQKHADARNELLSGGLSSGWKQLLDKGIVDEAGYIDSIKKIASKNGKEFEKIVEDAEKNGNDFNDALREGINKGIISTKTFSDAVFDLESKMSKMSKKELEAAGYTYDMVNQMKELSKGIKDGSINMDEFTTKIQNASGRENLISGLWNIANSFIEIGKQAKKAFAEIFPSGEGDNSPANKLYRLTVKFKAATDKFFSIFKSIKDANKGNETNKVLIDIKNTFKGIFAILKIGKTVLESVFKLIKPIFSLILPTSKGILSITGSLGEKLSFLADKFDKLANHSVTQLHNKFTDLRNNIKEKINSGEFTKLEKLFESIKSVVSKVKTEVVDFKNKFKESISSANSASKELDVNKWDVLYNIFKKINECIVKFAHGVSDALLNLGPRVNDFLQKFDPAKAVSIANGGIFASILLAVKKFVNNLPKIAENAEGIISSIKKAVKELPEILSSLKDSIKSFTTEIKARALKDISKSILMLTGALFILSTIKIENLTLSVSAMTTLFAELIGSLAILQKIEVKDQRKTSSALASMAFTILILASAVKKLSKIPFQNMLVGLTGITVLLSEMTVVALVLGRNTRKITQGCSALISMAIAMDIISVAVKKLSSIDSEGLKVGVKAVGKLMKYMTLFMLFTSKKTGLAASALGLISMATALDILVLGLKALEKSDYDKLKNGLKVLSKALFEMVIALKLLPMSGIQKGAGFLVLAAGLSAISVVVAILGKQDWEIINNGMKAFAGILTEMLIAARLMPRDFAVRAAGLLLFSTAISLMVAPIKILGKIGWGALAKSILSIAAGLGVMVGAAHLAKPVIGIMYALTGVLVGMGVAAMSTGAGLALLSTGLNILSTVGPVAASTASMALTMLVSSLIGLIPLILKKVTEGIVSLCGVFSEGAPALYEALVALLNIVVDAFSVVAPKVVTGVVTVLEYLLKLLVDHGPVIIGAVLDILILLIDTLSEKLPSIIKSIFTLIINFINGLANAINEKTKEFLTAVNNLIDSIVDAACETFENSGSKFVEVGEKMVGSIIEGIKNTVVDAKGAAKRLGEQAKSALKEVLGIASPSKETYEIGDFFVQGFSNAVSDKKKNSIKQIKMMGNESRDALSESFKKMGAGLDVDLSAHPVIKPVLDLSDIENKKSGLNGLFANKAFDLSASASLAYGALNDDQKYYSGSQSSSSSSVISFTQNNYSPKALSRVDIYRQTNNQLSQLKKVVGVK